MTTIKEILDKFDAPNRYSEKFESIDIGNYTFDEAFTERTGYLMDFTSKKNPDIFLEINDDRGIIRLVKKLEDDTVDVTRWWRREKVNKQFPADRFKPIPKNLRKPFPKKNKQ